MFLIIKPFELKMYDLMTGYTAPEAEFKDIVIIKVDQRTLDAFENIGASWPFPRDFYELVLRILSEAEAVFVDIIFSSHSSHGHQDDLNFSEGISLAGNVYMALPLSKREKDLSENEIEFIERNSLEGGFSSVEKFNSAEFPISELRDVLKGAGNVSIDPDRDGIYRKVPLFSKLGKYDVPDLTFSYFVNRSRVDIRQGDIFIDGDRLPVTKEGLLIRYTKNLHPFEEISFADVFNAALDPEASTDSRNLSREFFRDKYVLIGYTAKGLFDMKPIPLNPRASGMVIHAAALENLLHKNFNKPMPTIFTCLIMGLIAFVSTAFVLVNRHLVANTLFFILFTLIILLSSFLLLKNSIYMNTTGPLAALFLSFLGSVIYSYASEGRQRAFVRSTFSRYMDKTIVDHVLDNPSLVAPGGNREYATVLFADIAGFTTISEKISAEGTAAMLYEVLTEMTELIIKNKGVIDKYIGDCIMAFWGTPVSSNEDETMACLAALDCYRALAGINQKLAEKGIPPIDMRFGIHSGEVIAGNLGSERLFDYTVIGDTVNIASRLESANKFFKTRIIVSGATISKAEDIFETRMIGDIAVKGKSSAIPIYEMIGRTGTVDDDRLADVELFHKALQFFYERNFIRAAAVFDNILKHNPSDGAARFYKNRCETLLDVTEFDDNWEIIRMDTK
ncbi:MAG: adenylate/guanylate cyclase domain-containing protein [Desulfobacterales bacterium]|nr:adenylate/guanylate cyclase domain-containing protein [Desulfobacterales bacterium]